MNDKMNTERKTIDARELAEMICGKPVKDRVSDIIGYAVNVSVFLYGCEMIGMTFNRGTIGIDNRAIKISSAVFSDNDLDIDLAKTEITSEDKVILGKLCVDKVSGFKGVADQLIFSAGQETQVVLQPKAIENGSKLPERESFDYPRLQVLEEAVAQDDIQAEPEKRVGGCVLGRDHIPARDEFI